MSILDEAVRRDLAAASAPPPIERVRRRARRQRIRVIGSSLYSVLAIVIVVVIVISATGSDSERVATATSLPRNATTTSLPASVASLPIATEPTFPGLTRVLRIAHDYEAADGHVDYGEIVATTRDKTYVLFGGRQPVDTGPIYLVRLVGEFTCNECSRPARAAAPHGNQILFTVTRSESLPLNDVFEIGSRSIDLARFGRVYRLPRAVVSARVVLPSRTMRTGSTMAGSVQVKNNTGRPIHASGCNRFFQAALGSATIKPEIGWELCLRQLTIPTGESSYPVTLDAHYPRCSGDVPRNGEPACGTDGRPPKLEPGEYRAIVFAADPDVFPTPPPRTVRVTR